MPPSLTICNTDSLAEQIQKKFPRAKVVKTLNTTTASVMVDPNQVAHGDHDIFVSGNDAAAKQRVTSLLKEWFGWKSVIDLGDITTARGTEMLLPIWVRLWGALGTPNVQLQDCEVWTKQLRGLRARSPPSPAVREAPTEKQDSADRPSYLLTTSSLSGNLREAQPMTTAGAQIHWTDESTSEDSISLRRLLLSCGVVGAVLYPLSDILAVTRYPGFSYRDQAVSELFAIGAPTSAIVVPLFTLSSSLLFLFAIGIWMSANGQRWVRPMAVMMALNVIDALILWNVFPMHMRGVQPTFTDTMHGLLAIDPFLLAAVVLGALAFRGWFRVYTVTTIVFTTVLAIISLSFVTAFIANQPTPWMGATERAAQYATNLWYAALAVVLLRKQPAASQTRL